MEFYELINKRYSVRAYRPNAVEEDKLQRVLDAARLAPTACNNQPFRIVVASTDGKKEAFRRVYKADWLSDAPIVICACAVPSEAWTRGIDGKNHGDIDVAIVMDHLILAAANEGLGTCWICAFDPAAAVDVFELPDELVPVALTPLGYAADSPRPKLRKPLPELVIDRRS